MHSRRLTQPPPSSSSRASFCMASRKLASRRRVGSAWARRRAVDVVRNGRSPRSWDSLRGVWSASAFGSTSSDGRNASVHAGLSSGLPNSASAIARTLAVDTASAAHAASTGRPLTRGVCCVEPCPASFCVIAEREVAERNAVATASQLRSGTLRAKDR